MEEKMLNQNNDAIKREAEQNWENLKKSSNLNSSEVLEEKSEKSHSGGKLFYTNKKDNTETYGKSPKTTWKKVCTISLTIAFLVLLTGVAVFFAISPFKSKSDGEPTSEVFETNAVSHWKKCDVCGEEVDKSEHIYDNCLDETCNVCGYKRVAGHKYADEFEIDANMHYLVCLVCGSKKDQQEHIFEYGKCTVCGYVAETLEGLGYAFDSKTQSYYVNSINLPDVKYLKIPEVYDDGENGELPVTDISLLGSTGDILGLYLSKNINYFSAISLMDNFSCFDNLAEIVVDSENPLYHSAGNCVIETATKTLVLGCKNSVIPDDGSVIEIGMCAFCAESISYVDIPESVVAINYFAFTLFGNRTQEVLVVLPRSILGLTQCSLGGAIVCFNAETYSDFELYKLYVYVNDFENVVTYIKNAGPTGFAMYSETLPSEEEWEGADNEGFDYWHYMDGVPTLWDMDDLLKENN